jgi:hypothetical protein
VSEALYLVCTVAAGSALVVIPMFPPMAKDMPGRNAVPQYPRTARATTADIAPNTALAVPNRLNSMLPHREDWIDYRAYGHDRSDNVERNIHALRLAVDIACILQHFLVSVKI